MRVSTILAAVSLAALIAGREATAYTVTLNGYATSYLTTHANDRVGSNQFETVNPPAMPYSYTSTSLDGGASSESGYSLTNAGFDITLDQSRVGAANSFGQAEGSIFFSVNQGIDYVASGSYSVADSDGRIVYYRPFLYDRTVGSFVFENFQQSRATPNESFTLGGTGGDFSNSTFGSLTGTLIAGHDYEFNYYVMIHTSSTASPSGATASGNLSLSFSAIPEPSTGLLMVLGLVALAVSRHRQAIDHVPRRRKYPATNQSPTPLQPARMPGTNFRPRFKVPPTSPFR